MRSLVLTALLVLPSSLLAQRATTTKPINNPGPAAVVLPPGYYFNDVDEGARRTPPYLLLQWPKMAAVSTWHLWRSDAPSGRYFEIPIRGSSTEICHQQCIVQESYGENQALAGKTVWYRLEGTTDGLALPTAATVPFAVTVPGWVAPLQGLTWARTAYPSGLNIGWTLDPQVTDGYNVDAKSGSSHCFGHVPNGGNQIHVPTSLRDVATTVLCQAVVITGSIWTITVDGIYAANPYQHKRTASMTVTVP